MVRTFPGSFRYAVHGRGGTPKLTALLTAAMGSHCIDVVAVFGWPLQSPGGLARDVERNKASNSSIETLPSWLRSASIVGVSSLRRRKTAMRGLDFDSRRGADTSPIGNARRRKPALERRGRRVACRDRGHSRDDPAWDSVLGSCASLGGLRVYGRQLLSGRPALGWLANSGRRFAQWPPPSC
jgi:hypothetical protein